MSRILKTTAIFFITILSVLSCKTENEYISEYKEVHLITAQSAMCVEGEDGAQYNGEGNECQMFLCCNEDEIEFWRQGMLISFKLTNGELIDFVFVDLRESLISNVKERDDCWVGMKEPPTLVRIKDWDYMALLFPEFKQEGTYRFRVHMEMLDSGKTYHSQLFQLDLFDKEYDDRNGTSIKGYWAQLNVISQ